MLTVDVCAVCGCVSVNCECVHVLILHLLHTPERAWNINIPGFTSSDTSRQQKKALPTEAHKQVQLTPFTVDLCLFYSFTYCLTHYS